MPTVLICVSQFVLRDSEKNGECAKPSALAFLTRENNVNNSNGAGLLDFYCFRAPVCPHVESS